MTSARVSLMPMAKANVTSQPKASLPQQATLVKALKKYNINTKTPLAYATFPVMAKGHVISIQYNQVEKDGYIAAETLTAFNSQHGGKKPYLRKPLIMQRPAP